MQHHSNDWLVELFAQVISVFSLFFFFQILICYRSIQPALSGYVKGEAFPSAEQSVVVRCKAANGRQAVLKASAVDAGRVLNEANYLSELRGRARRLLGSSDGFVEVILPPRQVELSSCKPAFFVMEAVDGGSLQDLARPGKCFSSAEVAMLGLQLVHRLQVMHTQENSLGLVHRCVFK